MKKSAFHIIAGGLALILAMAARAQLTDFTIIDFPDNPMNRSQILGMNDAGDIVGAYPSSGTVTWHGWLLKAGKFTTIDFPGAFQTKLLDINAAGDIVGMYVDPGNKYHGFLLSGSRSTTVDYPGAENTVASGTNAQGEIVGRYWSASDGTNRRGFLLSGGRFTTIQHPEAVSLMAFGINDQGDIIGSWVDAAGIRRGFLLRRGTFTTLEFPGARATFNEIGGINNAGDIVGPYLDARGKIKGFVLRDGRYTSFDIPGSGSTYLDQINAAGQIVGWYMDAVSTHGFLSTIAPPSVSQPILVDDDGADCPGALTTIQEAVRRAAPGATILVCRGIYTGTVNIIGPEKAALKLIALGRAHEVIIQVNGNLATCGIEVQGAKSANNYLSLNMAYGHKLAGIMLAGAGPGNVVQDNTVLANGRFGIDVQNTSEVWIEGNRVSYGRGFWGTTPGGQQPGLGLNLANLLKATVFDNRARNNTGADLNWDGKGDNRLEANAGETCVPASACGK